MKVGTGIMDFLMRPEILIALMLVAVLARVRTSAGWLVSEDSASAAALERRARRSGCARPIRSPRAPSYR